MGILLLVGLYLMERVLNRLRLVIGEVLSISNRASANPFTEHDDIGPAVGDGPR